MDDILDTLVSSLVIGTQSLAVIAARRVQPDAPRDTRRTIAPHAMTPDAARVQHIWLFG